MAALNDLIAQIADPDLRDRIQQEVNKLSKQKKFGLVWENHEQENALLQGVPVKVGKVVAIKGEAVNDTYLVQSIADGKASCLHHKDQTTVQMPVNQLVCVARVGDAIYPYLESLDSVCNAPDSDLWHTLIEADNYHALQLLEYLYAGKVDCIYIDPPYNTGAKDWKYNNDYVDVNDSYRHSRWLSMMEKRLKLAKQLLNPEDSVLIVTIDEKEYLHLGCLLEDLFPEANTQMISSVINPYGTQRLNEFSRNDEYIFFVMLGKSHPESVAATEESSDQSYWKTYRRGDLSSRRGQPKGGKAQFYPIYVNEQTGAIQCFGDPIAPGIDRNSVPQIDGCYAVFPLRDDGTEMNWCTRKESAEFLLSKGYIKAGRRNERTEQKYPILYLRSGTIDDINDGKLVVDGHDIDGSIIAHYAAQREQMPQTNWQIKEHSARDHGTNLLKKFWPDKRFTFPKSLYAVSDCIDLFVRNKPTALIIDFFAGSGTTLHAVNLLNAKDDGHRRCIMVTNNEVYENEAKQLASKGFYEGSNEWNALGIARYVTWPRTVCSIEGHDVNGNPLKGNYIGSERPMADGFKANAAFFKLGFLDKTAVTLGRKFKELLPVMWMQAGAHGPCPTFEGMFPPPYLIFAENRFAILNDENCFAAFAQALDQVPEIETVFLMTESESGYQEMLNALPGKVTHQLYREYTDHFRINIGR